MLPLLGISLLVILMALPAKSHAQPAQGNFARIVVIKPKPGATAEFTAGYQRHLAWHKSHNDPWSWYGWTFALGDRLGQFMDGTFGHALSNFDNAVAPAEDAADNQLNVVPYADFVSHGIYERLPHLSHGAPLPDRSPYLVLNTVTVRPGQENAFESSMKELRGGRISVFKLKLGGPSTQYLLMRAVETFSAGALLSDIPLPTGTIEKAQSELLRFEQKMSYFPE